jgi:T5orf172 domain/Sigma-70 region 2
MLLFVVGSYMGFDSDDIWHDIPTINIATDSIPTDDSIFRINLDTFVGCWESFSSMSTAQKRDRLSQIFNIDYFDSATVLTNADSLEKLKKSGFYDRSPADQSGFIYIYTFEDNVLAGLYEQGLFWWKNRRYETKLKIGRTEQNVFRRIHQQFDNKTGISEPPILLAVFWTKLVVQCERGIHCDLTHKRLKDNEGNLAKGGVEWFKDTPTQILPTVIQWVKHCNYLQHSIPTSLYKSVECDDSAASDLDLQASVYTGEDKDNLQTSSRELLFSYIDKKASLNVIYYYLSYNNYCSKYLAQYLQDIKKIKRLGRKEEVAEAQFIQRYVQLLKLRTQAAEQVKMGKSDDLTILKYMELLEICDQLKAHEGFNPNLEYCAIMAGISTAEFKCRLVAGKQRWAELAKVTVAEINAIQNSGIRAKERMIKANLHVVVSAAKRCQNRGLELWDLIQEGVVGLGRAVDEFNPTKVYWFDPNPLIQEEINRAIRAEFQRKQEERRINN